MFSSLKWLFDLRGTAALSQPINSAILKFLINYIFGCTCKREPRFERDQRVSARNTTLDATDPTRQCEAIYIYTGQGILESPSIFLQIPGYVQINIENAISRLSSTHRRQALYLYVLRKIGRISVWRF